MGLQIQVLRTSTSREIDAAFATFVRERPEALFVSPDGFFNGRRIQLVLLAAFHRVPATFASREYAEAGGLMSYGTNIADAFRQLGAYAGRILKGTKPADLPVVQSSKFELVINHQTARMLGLTVPDKLPPPPRGVLKDWRGGQKKKPPPPKFSPSGRGRCRAAGPIADRLGADLSRSDNHCPAIRSR